MATISRDSGKRNSTHRNASTGAASAMAPASQDSSNITIGTVGNPGRSTTPKLITGTQDAGSLSFNSGQITSGADKATNVADNFDKSFNQPTSRLLKN